MEFPTIANIKPEVLMLLGFWLFTAIQFTKGKVYPDKLTSYVSLVAPFLVAAVPVWGGENMNAYAQVVAELYLMGTGVWAINKAGKSE